MPTAQGTIEPLDPPSGGAAFLIFLRHTKAGTNLRTLVSLEYWTAESLFVYTCRAWMDSLAYIYLLRNRGIGVQGKGLGPIIYMYCIHKLVQTTIPLMTQLLLSDRDPSPSNEADTRDVE